MAKVRVNWGAADGDAPVAVFAVYNTSHKVLYVLARDRSEAMSIAQTANHVYGTAEFIGTDNDRFADEVTFIPRMFEHQIEMIEAARMLRVRGTLHVDGDTLSIGSKQVNK